MTSTSQSGLEKWADWGRKFALVLLVLMIPTYFFRAMTVELNPDEGQMIAAGSEMARGQRLYTEVWDNHGPLTSYLLEAFFHVFQPQNYPFLYVLRFFALVIMAGVFGVFFLWARKLFDGNRLFLPLACLYFLLSPVLSQKGIEIRGDNPLNLVWGIAILVWFEAWRREKALWWFLGGVVIGVGFGFSVKTLTLGLSVFPMFILAMWVKKKIDIKPLIFYGLGSLIFPIIMALVMKKAGNFDAFMDSYLGQNFDRERPGLLDGYSELTDLGFIWFNTQLLALIYTGIAIYKKKLPKPLMILWPCAFLQVFQFLFLLPTHYYQSYLTAMAPITPLVIWSLIEWAKTANQRFSPNWNSPKARVLVPLGSLVVVGLMIGTWEFDDSTLGDAVRKSDDLTLVIDRDDYVFDGYSYPFMNPKPHYVKSFVNTVIDRLKAGEMGFDVVDGLDETDTPFTIYGKRTADMPEDVIEYLESNMIPTNIPKLLASGKVVSEAGPLTIRIAGKYNILTPNDSNQEVRINGEICGATIELKDGEYQIDFSGDGPVILSIVPAERVGDWEAMSRIGLPSRDDDYSDTVRLIWPDDLRSALRDD